MVALYANDIVSMEAGAPPGQSRESKGLDAVKAKGEWWNNTHEVHSANVIVPYRDGKRPTHRSYYPLYSKCVELGIPVTITVGMPLVQRAGTVQDPRYLDKVCAFFPELVIVSAHGGAPWTSTLVQLLRTWPNLYHMISAYAPSRYPPELISFANSKRGYKKIMFASDYPLLSFERVRRELPECGVSAETVPWFTVHNAARVFWGEDSTLPSAV